MAKDAPKQSSTRKVVETIRHYDAQRKNIPTAEYQSVMDKDDRATVEVAYERRNRDLDPQLVWRGKDEQDWSDLVVHAPPLYIQDKVHAKVLIDDLLKHSKGRSEEAGQAELDLFADFNGIPEGAEKTEFYQHDQNWTNRMILGDSLQVMASLAEREGLRGKVQCIYLDPPYGIKFNSNFQWSTTSRDVRDGKADHITREPEMVKAFRDTWRDGIHSYLSYLRDRLTVARDLLTDSGSIFVQIGDENVHLVRSTLDEVFGAENYVSTIFFQKSGGFTANYLAGTNDYILWYAKKNETLKYRPLLTDKSENTKLIEHYNQDDGDGRKYRLSPINSQGASAARTVDIKFRGKHYHPGANRHWSIDPNRIPLLLNIEQLVIGGSSIYRKLFVDYQPGQALSNNWDDTARGSFHENSIYVVQTTTKTIQRCILMSTDPGDLVLDPTCGSGTTATVAEQWGRRWITIDTSRVALALARARIMGARYPFYLLADSREGQLKEAEATRTAPSMQATHGNVRHGFVYERVPHITLKSIANNLEIDVIWEKWQVKLEPLRSQLNSALAKQWEEWEIPRDADAQWPDTAKRAHAEWWEARIARQKEIDASIAAKAEFEYLYDKPYEDKKKVRVAGPFTVESLSPHRVLAVDEDEQFVDPQALPRVSPDESQERDGFVEMILENLRVAGVQQVHKEDKINFLSLTPWPGSYICAEARYEEAGVTKRAGVFLGPEFGTVSRPDLVEAAREAGDADFDVLIACAFNFDAHSSEFDKLGRIPVLKARMNADLHMADELKNTGAGNLFVIFGEPDIDVKEQDGLIRVQINGVDVFDPRTGEVRSDGADGIACWFIDTDYNGESFFVRHAYFLGANDPYKSLKTTLKAEIDEVAWSTLNSDVSRPFKKPQSGRIAVKVINHLGDEVMKVFRV